jgi:ElaB/YqjD/DUF883 family membrane-anchored ribosome-binding protein
MPNNDPYPPATYTGNTGNMPGSGWESGNSGTVNTEGVRERVSDMTQQAREKANQFGRKSADAIDRNLDAAAGKLASTADSLRTRAGTGGDRVSHMATTAADKLDATARYFRDHHTRDMVSGAESLVRRNPGASICAALAIGFLLGAAMKKDNRY